jgi:serine/threonine protein kinase/WD40 repeat protein
MPNPAEPNRTVASPADLSASAASSADDTASAAPRSGSAPKFGPPSAAGEVGTLGPYRVLKELGRGGMGAVYVAIDTRLGRRVALKVMLPEFAADPESKGRFLREAKAAALIGHDHVVTVFEADERDGVPYIAMQLLQGYPLDQYLKQKRLLPLGHVVRIGREAALGLAAAHEQGLIHRDIKPANLWLESPHGRVKVLDFGLARPVGTDSELTKSGAVVGTPAYMSPEQARGLRVDHRTDLFSLGAVLYRLCAGRNPFAGEHTLAVLAALLTDEPTPVRALNPQVPEPLAQLIHALLAKNPAHRPQTAAEVAEWLRMILDGTLPPGAGLSAVSAAQPAVVAIPLPTPMSVTAQPESAFANLVDEDDESDATELADPPAPPRKGGRGVLLAAGGAVLLALAVVAVALPQLTKKPQPVPAVAEGTPPVPGPGGRQLGAPPKKEPDNPAEPKKDEPQPALRPPKPWKPPAPVPVGQSQFDKLDPAAIPKEERFDWQPKELVAVAGTHSPRTYGPLRWARGFAVSPDGATVVTGGEFSPLRVWDVKMRTLKFDLPPLHEYSNCAFSPDGRHLITYHDGPNRYVRFDLTEPTKPPTDWPNSLPPQSKGMGLWLAPDGSRMVTQTSGHAIAYDLTPTPARELAKLEIPWDWGSRVIAPNRDCTRLAMFRTDPKGVVVYDLTADGAKEVFAVPTESTLTAISPDGMKLVTWHAGALRLWNLSDEKPTHVEFAARTAGPVAFDPTGKRLVTQDSDRALRLWDTTKPFPQPVWNAPLALTKEGATRVAFAGADGNTLVALSVSGFVHFVDVSGDKPKVLNPIEPSEPIGPELAIDGATGRVALGRAEDDRRQVWDFSGAKPVPTEQALPRGLVAHTPDFKRMAVWENGRLNLLVDGTAVGSLAAMGAEGAFTSDGRQYWGQAEQEGRPWRAVGWDLTGPVPREIGSFPIKPGHWLGYRVVRNDTVLARFSDGSGLTFWDLTAEGPKLLSALGPTHPNTCLFPDGERFIRTDHAVPQMWRLQDGGWKAVWSGPPDNSVQLAAHPSGRYFALYAQGEITVRNADDPKIPAHIIPYGKAPPQKLEFAPDGRHLFVVNAFNTVYVLRIPGLDADRAAAEWALGVGGGVAVQRGADIRTIEAAADLPAGPFAAVHFYLNKAGARVADADLDRLVGLPAVTDLDLSGTAVTDAGAERIGRAVGLKKVWVAQTRVTDAGVAHLRGLARLEDLHLAATPVTDAALEHLKGLTRLRWLCADQTGVTDAGLAHLAGLTDLTRVSVRKTKVTAAGVEKLAKALPGCSIEWDGGEIGPKKP